MNRLIPVLIAWIIAYSTAKILYIIHPQMDPMCSRYQPWLGCISDVSLYSLAIDGVTAVTTLVSCAVSIGLILIWPRRIDRLLAVVIGLCAGIVSLFIFPTDKISDIEQVFEKDFGFAGSALVWLTFLTLPYLVAMAIHGIGQRHHSGRRP